MSRVVRIDVTAEDIAAGREADCTACPIAIAASRACGRRMLTGPRRTGEYDDAGDFVGKPLRTPPEATCWMGHFDAGRPVEPFAFDLDMDAFYEAEASR